MTTPGTGLSLPARITVREVGLRDGLQDLADVVPTDAKLELLDLLLAAGLRRVNLSSFVRADRVPQLADAEELFTRAPRPDGVVYGATVANDRGIERALPVRPHELGFPYSASETFLRRNVNRGSREFLELLARWIRRAHDAGAGASVGISMAFGCPDEGVVAPERVRDAAVACADRGADRILLADTTGTGDPASVYRVVSLCLDALPEPVTLGLHLHDPRGTGLASVLAAMQAGCTFFDASIAGLGGCPFAPGASGNIATEDLVHLCDRMGIETGVDLDALLAAVAYVRDRIGAPVRSAVGHAGPVRLPMV